MTRPWKVLKSAPSLKKSASKLAPTGRD